MGSNSSLNISIPSVFISMEDGHKLLNAFGGQLTLDLPVVVSFTGFQLNSDVFLEAIHIALLGFVAASLIGFLYTWLISKICDYERYRALHRLPVRKFFTVETSFYAKSGEPCSICLEDFETLQNVKTLPCQHEYHAECIDTWLTSRSGKCPLCRTTALPLKLDKYDTKHSLENYREAFHSISALDIAHSFCIVGLVLFLKPICEFIFNF